MLLLQTKVVRLVRYGISKMCTSLIYFALCPPNTPDTWHLLGPRNCVPPTFVTDVPCWRHSDGTEYYIGWIVLV